MRTLAFLLALSSMPAVAASWMYLSADSLGNPLYLDIASISNDKAAGRVKVWVKSTYDPPRAASPGEAAIAETRELWIFDCRNRRTFVKQSVSYGIAGVILDNFNNRFEPFADIVPDTLAEVVIENVCGKPPSAPRK